MIPEEFEKLVHRLHEKAFYAKDGLTGSYGEEYDAVLSAYRAAWENRVPEEATLISCPGSRGGIVLLYVQNAQWIVCSRGKNYAAAPTPALALEAWRRAGERSEG